MKKIFLTILCILSLSVSVLADTSIVYNNEALTFEKPVIIRNSTSFLSLREIAVKLLSEVELQWDAGTKTATLSNSTTTVKVPIGQIYIVVNGTNRAIDSNNAEVASFIDNSATYVPIRCIAEAFGYNVSYNDKTVYVSNKAEITTEATTEAQSEFVLPQFAPIKTGETIATMHTNMGDISFRFFEKYAPKAVENFLTHAKDGYYDGVEFHRVINDFMIQGGDPTATGRGGESIYGKDFENEVSIDLRNFRGALCMANAGADTNGSQFYIVQCKEIAPQEKAAFEQMLEPKNATDSKFGNGPVSLFPKAVIEKYMEIGGYPSLDMDYTVFGQVTSGMDIVDKIAAVKTDENNKPLEKVVINKIDVSNY